MCLLCLKQHSTCRVMLSFFVRGHSPIIIIFFYDRPVLPCPPSVFRSEPLAFKNILPLWLQAIPQGI